MRRVLPFLMLLPLALFTSGCVYALATKSQATDVKLKLQNPQPQQYSARVGCIGPADYQVASDGRVEFTVPSFQNGCSVYCFGVTTRDASPEKARVIELRRGDRVVRRLSLAQIAELPPDEAGFRAVKVRD